MFSSFSKFIDRAVDSQFRKDPGGRLVFVPGRKGKCYFVDSKSDEEKIRALAKMHLSAIQLISWLTFPVLYVPAVILEDYAGLTPRGHRLAIALGIPAIFWLVLIALMLMLWGLYRQAVPSLTASLSEVGPELKGQLTPLTEISPGRRRLALLCFGASLLILGLVFFLVGVRRPTSKTGTCPPQPTSSQQMQGDSSQRPCAQS